MLLRKRRISADSLATGLQVSRPASVGIIGMVHLHWAQVAKLARKIIFALAEAGYSYHRWVGFYARSNRASFYF